MTAPATRIEAHEYGDSGVLFDVVAPDYEERWLLTQAIGSGLRDEPPPGFIDVVASFQNVFVAFDPRITTHVAITAAVGRLAEVTPPRVPPRTFEVAVLYGEDAGPDLATVAKESGLTAAQVVEAHSAARWTVRFVGSPIGAPLLDGSQLPVSIPRLATPRQRVEPGSVGLSGRQCVIYNAASPGGWQLVGRTPNIMFDITTPPHVRYRPGDQFRFRPITAAEWEAWRVPPQEVTS
jgi:KipI family sensor histidine kinase inhibitor